MITMYLPVVYMHDERGSTPAPRAIQPTLEQARSVLDNEAVLDWTNEFGGCVARRGELTYEVVPVQVNLSGSV